MHSIKKVAEVAGVSVGTVSHVITGSVRVSEALRLKVEAAIQELNYHPNHVARSLKTNRTRTLGIMVPDLTISFFPQVIRGAEMAARARGYTVIAVNSDDDAERQKELLSLFLSQRVEGILLVIAAGPTPLHQISRILDAGTPIVCLDRIPDRIAVDSVSVDDVQAAEMGVDHLIAAGNRTIAIVTGPVSLKNERRRLSGYRQALRRAGLPADEGLVWTGNLRVADVTAMCKERLTGSQPLPDAIFCTNGPTALGVLRALHELRLRTPEDIAFLTFDQLTVDDLFSPSVTSVLQPAYDIGYRAAEILLARIESRQKSPVSDPLTVRLPATLKVGQTSRRTGERPASKANGAPILHDPASGL